MKTIKFLFLAVIVTLSSCTIEKRQHMSGYYIDWKKSKQNTGITESSHKPTPETLTTHDVKKTDPQSIVQSICMAQEKEEKASGVFKTEKVSQEIKRKEQLLSKKVEGSKDHETVKKSESSVNKTLVKKSSRKPGGDDKMLYVLLAIFVPFIAVGLATDWGIEVLWNILWTLLCGIPGIIHAFIILKRKGII